jgi:aspartyl-tRNA(Asn)/glutamyl-tRNA(Gln) amidotransferase subunit A
MAGPHPDDPTAIQEGPPDFQVGLERGVAGLRMAWSPDWGTAAVDPESRALAESGARAFEALGAHVEELDFVLDEEAIRSTFVSMFLSDMDAAFGHFLDRYPDLLMPSLRQWLEEARTWRAADLSRALRDLEWHRAIIRGLFQRYDLLLTPTTAVPAFPVEGWPDTIGGRPVDPLWGFNPFCYVFNMTGHPAASVPCGFARGLAPDAQPGGGGTTGLPVGLQIAGRLGDEVTVLRASAAFEAARPWSQHRPAVA